MKKIILIIFIMFSMFGYSQEVKTSKDSSFVKTGLITIGSVSILSGVSLLYIDQYNYRPAKTIPIGMGVTILISGLFYKKK